MSKMVSIVLFVGYIIKILLNILFKLRKMEKNS